MKYTLSLAFKKTLSGDGEKELGPNPKKWRAHSKHATSQEKKVIMDKRPLVVALRLTLKRFTKITKKKSRNTSKDATKGNGTSQPQKKCKGSIRKCV